MKTLFELENLIKNSSSNIKNYYINYNDFSKIYDKVVAYEPCNTIGNLETFYENYRTPQQKNKSFMELAKSGLLDNQHGPTKDNLGFILFPEYEMHLMVPEPMECTVSSEDGEIVEVESEDSDVQTDDSDDSGDGDDDDPSHPLALTFVSNNFYYDNQSKPRKVVLNSFLKSIGKLPASIILLSISSVIFKCNPLFEIVQAITAVENGNLLFTLVKLILKYIFNNI